MADDTLARLTKMHRFMRSQPEDLRVQVPSLAALHLAFVAGLRIGDWGSALACIEEIDHWSLDQAPKTLQMRIRLLDARGAMSELFQFVIKNHAWEFNHPRRISSAILRAVDSEAIKPIETADGIDSALTHFREEWYPRLMQAVADTVGLRDVVRIQAYSACADRDFERLMGLVPDSEDGLAARLFKRWAPEQADATSSPVATVGSPPLQNLSVIPPSAGERFWSSLQSAVREGKSDRTRFLIEALDSELLSDVEFLSRGPDALLELLSDPDVEKRTVSRLLLQETIAGMIDAFVVASGFPRLEHLEIYIALIEGLVLLRGEASNDADSQLLLGLLSAVAQLSPKSCHRCEEIIRIWWKQRSTVTRLGWLAAALDSLAPLHPRPDALTDLFVNALEFGARKQHQLSASEVRAWSRIGRALEIEDGLIHQLVEPLTSHATDEQIDDLATAGLKRIAIVSLQEASAKNAAKELAERTGAKVTIVTSLVSDGLTRNAAGADIILYVWAASTHATYRAFDFNRDRLVYVQGTGASSIIAAAEGWAKRKVDSTAVETTTA